MEVVHTVEMIIIGETILRGGIILMKWMILMITIIQETLEIEGLIGINQMVIFKFELNYSNIFFD